MVSAMTVKEQIILLLLILMAVVLAMELTYILLKKKRRKKEMSLFRKETERPEPLADRAHNAILTTEGISSTLARQGVDTGEADALLHEARSNLSMRDFTGAIERAEAAKLVLLRLKREGARTGQASHADSGRRPMDESLFTQPETKLNEEKSLEKLPANYLQAKFMLSTTKDALEKKGIRNGEAFDHYQTAAKAFEREDYTKALSYAIKAEKLVDSGSLTLIGEEKQAPVEGEALEVWTCPSCESEVSEDDVFCRKCGQTLSRERECPGCGVETDSSDMFCRKCGYKLK
jgi:hypothetical protein